MDTLKMQASRIGYEMYLANGSGRSKDEINAQLHASGLPPISDRTFDHYRRMVRHGQLTYMPINDFDMAVKHHDLPAA